MNVRCPNCGECPAAAEWNEATNLHFGGGIITIEQAMRGDRFASFFCPCCTTMTTAQNLEAVPDALVSTSVDGNGRRIETYRYVLNGPVQNLTGDDGVNTTHEMIGVTTCGKPVVIFGQEAEIGDLKLVEVQVEIQQEHVDASVWNGGSPIYRSIPTARTVTVTGKRYAYDLRSSIRLNIDTTAIQTAIARASDSLRQALNDMYDDNRRRRR